MRRALAERLSSPAVTQADDRQHWARLRALPVTSRIALGLLGLVVLMAITAPLIAQDPLASGTPVQAPGAAHWFGTDDIGRDVFARVAFGARSSLLIGLGATVVALLVAAVLGSIAATARRWVAEVLMRILDVVMSFPGIALAAVLIAVFGSTLPVLIGALAFLYVPQLTRIVRASVLAQMGEDYVAASKVMGASTPWILVRDVVRNCAAPILVFATVLVADAIVFEASLSFINAGVRPPDPSWGNILSGGKSLLLSGYWWVTFFPGLLILLTVLALNVLSEGMTDALVSPRARRRVKIADTSVIDAISTPAVTSAVAPAAVADEAKSLSLVELAESAQREERAQRALTESLQRLSIAERDRSDRHLSFSSAPPLLDVRNLSIAFPGAHGEVDIVDDVSFSVRAGETMGLVGESGCGKSITSMAVMGLLPPTAQLRGQILFDGRDLLSVPARERNALRGHEIAMVYQDALSSLNPAMLIRSQLNQLIRRGGRRSATELLEMVGLDPARTLKSYPHELSGGQRQRVLIAMALSRDPSLVMADEPTTALDVTVQRQVVQLLEELREELGFAMVFVSHDLALVAELAHHVTVMYAGQVVESGPTGELLGDPRHEYTRGLLGAVLSMEMGAARLHQVPGVVPAPSDFVAGDRFSPRSTRPDVGRDRRAVMRQVAGTSHWYATHPELDTQRDGVEAGR
ncbi:dipeptide/oligopeptide/nickel ABC transporter permease/ATP-binding protein [Kineococcus sp. SYSU DK002]|uniref:dipeptide/oligopeptide/nickel ABC transporter permease/ATP-binding protein n=1 Tax=Kineococcus sp. SYSU DK002 TaxID=3383123 RepID=UPI003D7C53AA